MKNALKLVALLLVLVIGSPASAQDQVAIGSTEAGAGSLKLFPDFGATVALSQGPCAEGVCLYTASGTTFVSEPDSQIAGFNALAAASEVTFEVLSADAGASVIIDGTELRSTGDLIALGVTPGINVLPTWVATVPEGQDRDFQIAFRITTSSGTYGASDAQIVSLTVRADAVSETPTISVLATETPVDATATVGPDSTDTPLPPTETPPPASATPSGAIASATPTGGSPTDTPTAGVTTTATGEQTTPTATKEETATATATATPAHLFGDVNCDGVVSPADLIAFFLALEGSGTGHATACDPDVNGNGMLDECDVDQTIAAMFGNPPPPCAPVPFTIRFRPMVGDQPFACGNLYSGIGTTGASIIPSDFRLYIFGIRLVTADGQETPLQLVQDKLWQYRDVVLLDFEDKTRPCNDGTVQTNLIVRGEAPPLRYTGIRFNLGVPFDLDHGDAASAPSPLNLTSMFWSWQDGYKFMRVDTAQDNVRIHLGSIGCVLGPGNRTSYCARPNVGAVDLPAFDPSSQVIVADLAAALQDSNIDANQPDTAPGCMSDADDLDCIPIMKNLGVNFSDGSPSPETQTFFRAADQ